MITEVILMTKRMTVLEYLDRYGEMQIADNDNQKIFWSNPTKKAIGGMLKAGDFKRLGIF